jgi:autotransporter-associated beta strand protein/probable HAF family extracellular repeat protein
MSRLRPVFHRLLLTFALTSLLASRARAVLTYSVTDLGVLSELAGRGDSKPYGINSNGQVAMTNVIGGAYRGLRYNRTSTDVLGTLGGNESLAFGINDAGSVVGRSDTSTGFPHAVLWTPDGATTDLGTLGGLESEAYSINSAGQVTGYAQLADGYYHAYLYSAGNMADVGQLLLSDCPNSYGLDINDAGNLVVWADKAYARDAYAYLYADGAMINLGNLGGESGVAVAVPVSLNNHNRVAGYSTTAVGTDHAFFFDGARMNDLGTLGGNWSYALALNNSDVVVGGAFADPDDVTYHAFAYFGGPLVDLNSRLDASGSGWVLEEATSINDSGQIVGTGTFGLEYHGFLLDPIWSTLAVTGLPVQTFHTPTATYAATIADTEQPVSVVKAGPGTLLLAANNSYTGTTTIAEGTLRVEGLVPTDGASSLGNAASPIVLGGADTQGTLEYTGGTATCTRGFTVQAGGAQVLHNGSGKLTIAVRPITGADGGSLTIGGAGDVAISSQITLGEGQLIKTGPAVLELDNGGSLFAGTLVDEGTLLVTKVGALPDGAPLSISAQATVVLQADLNLASGAMAVVAKRPVQSVPEPPAVALLAAGVLVSMGAWLRQQWNERSSRAPLVAMLFPRPFCGKE